MSIQRRSSADGIANLTLQGGSNNNKVAVTNEISSITAYLHDKQTDKRERKKDKSSHLKPQTSYARQQLNQSTTQIGFRQATAGYSQKVPQALLQQNRHYVTRTGHKVGDRWGVNRAVERQQGPREAKVEMAKLRRGEQTRQWIRGWAKGEETEKPQEESDPVQHSSGQIETLRRTNNQASSAPKFTPVGQFSELHCKYELYRNGSPNDYQSKIETIKARNFLNKINVVDLPVLDYVLSEIEKGDQKDDQSRGVNQRDFSLYPSLSKLSTSYRDMLSEKQEMKDFLDWFSTKMAQIQQEKETSAAKKFQMRQNVIASGFNEMLAQTARLSKTRAQLMKMLWNTEVQQLSDIVGVLSNQKFNTEKSYLDQMKTLHTDYQNEIVILRQRCLDLEHKLEREQTYAEGCTNSLRVLRRRLNKLEKTLRICNESYTALRLEQINLLDENTKLLMMSRDITPQETRMLSYRRLQLNAQRHRVKAKTSPFHPANVKGPGTHQLGPVGFDLAAKKQQLFGYYKDRIRFYPEQKLFLLEGCFDQDDDMPGNADLDRMMEAIIMNSPTIAQELVMEGKQLPRFSNQSTCTDQDMVGIHELDSRFSLVLRVDKAIQTIDYHTDRGRENDYRGILAMHTAHGKTAGLKAADIQKGEEEWQRSIEKKIQMQKINVRNSLVLLEVEQIEKIQKMARRASKKILKEELVHTIEGSISESNSSNNNISPSSFQDLHAPPTQSSPSKRRQSHFAPNDSKQDYLSPSNFKMSSASAKKPSQVIRHRKSIQFKNQIQDIRKPTQSSILRTSNSQVSFIDRRVYCQDLLAGGDREAQLHDLIMTFIRTHASVKPPLNPEKFLAKVIVAVFKNACPPTPHTLSLSEELLYAVKTNYGNIKAYMSKFLMTVNIIKQCQTFSPMLRILAMLLRVSDKYAVYDPVNCQDLSSFFFNMFNQLSLRSKEESGFNVWKSCTNLSRLRSTEFQAVLNRHLSQSKVMYISIKVSQFAATTAAGIPGAGSVVNDRKSSLLQASSQVNLIDNQVVLQLAPLIQYILEVYLIQKFNYWQSYHTLLKLVCDGDTLSIDAFMLLLDTVGIEEARQTDIMDKAFSFQYDQKFGPDHFYRICVHEDFPLFEELKVAIHKQFKEQLPEEVRNRYYALVMALSGGQFSHTIGAVADEWPTLQQELISKYRMNEQGHERVYSKLLEVLERRIINSSRQVTNIIDMDDTAGVMAKVAVLCAFKRDFNEEAKINQRSSEQIDEKKEVEPS